MKRMNVNSVGSTCLMILASVSLVSFQAPPGKTEVTLYNNAPRHLWNRLHAALFVRTAPDGSTWGHDRLDLFMCRSLVGEPEKTALTTLDEFLEKGGESQVTDPVKRALLQRDLWSAFDGAVWHEKHWNPSKDLQKYLAELEPRLARAIRLLALPAEDIGRLPDTYARAVASKEFAESFDPGHPERPFLPPDLFASDGPWICLNSGSSALPLAMNHVTMFYGRSSFLVFLRHPDGREKGLEVLKQVNVKGKGEKDAGTVQFPPLPSGAVLALVRQMALPDGAGELVRTPMTESVEIRVHLGQEKAGEHMRGTQSTFPQAVAQFTLSRARLFKNQTGGLRPTGTDEKEVAFDLFNRRHMDFVEENDHSDRPGAILSGSVVTHPVLLSCAGCHAYPTWSNRDWSMQSVWSIAPAHSGGSSLPVEASSPSEQGDRTIRWKKTREEWSALRELWK